VPSFVRYFTALVLILPVAGAYAGPPGVYCPPVTPCPGLPLPGQPGAAAAPGAGDAGAAQAPGTDTFAQAPPTGGEAAQSVVPNMIGDLFGGRIAYTPVYATIPGVAGAQFISRSASVPQNIVGGTTFTTDIFVNGIRVPAGTPLPGALVAPLLANARIPAGGASILPLLKIVENESALPEDRVYTTYNYYNDVERNLNPAPSQENVHREIFGFEKTFLDGNASIGFRLPFYETYGDDLANRGLVGDLNIIFKYALINNRETGNVLSTGIVVTAPTGSDFQPTGFGAPIIHDTLLQPYLSAIYRLNGDFFAQGFTSIVAPTDARDATLFDNDLGVGYFAYRDCSGDRILTAVIPTIEVHATTPLTHRGVLSEPVGVADLVDITFGTSFGIGSKSTLTLGAAVPVVGPRPFDIEGQVLFNCRF
jgi:hypothetical protein